MNCLPRVLLSVALAGPLTMPVFSQVNWTSVDSAFQPLPAGVHVYRTASALDGKPNIAYYLEADLSADLRFTADTSFKRRLTPSGFYEKNNKPLAVVNTSFFSFSTHQNLNLVIRGGRLIAYNQHSIPGRGRDTLTYRHTLGSAIGIDRRGKADVAWVFTDTALRRAYALQEPASWYRDSIDDPGLADAKRKFTGGKNLRKWNMETAVGGGPVLLQKGAVAISNNEEWKFAGKAINDRHPRTAMGYTADGRLIILVVQGRSPGIAEGASLIHLANMLREIGCVEAINLDGGGSSCLLVNGKETIRVCNAGGQRPVPGVFMIQ